MLRSLTFYWRINAAVLLGSATASAVLTGALLVGDSVRGSLRDLTLERLGRIDQALVAERYFHEKILAAFQRTAPEEPAPSHVAPAIILRGAAMHADTRARAAKIHLFGIDARFAALYPPGAAALLGRELARAPGPSFPSVVLNKSLSLELRASVGDPLIMTFPRGGDVPADTLLGRRDVKDVVATMRCTLTGVIPDRGPGLFSLSAHRSLPRNAYLLLPDLQKALGRQRKVNALLVGQDAGSSAILGEILAGALDLDDLGILLTRTPEHVSLESHEFVLRPELVERLEAVAASLGGTVQRFHTYLAIAIRYQDASVPYSTITAIDPVGPPFAGLRLTNSVPAPRLAEGEILLNEWTAQDLGVPAGGEVAVEYFVLGEREDLLTRTSLFRLRGVVAMSGLAADRALAPDYPGIKEAKDIALWDPPFPVELSRIRQRDEEYWDRFGATPKAFVSKETGARLWTNRFGNVTALRIAPAAGTDLSHFASRLRAEIRRQVPLDLFGLRVRDIRQEGLRAAGGATDFGLLFLGFSLFLIISSALLSGLLFRLGVERRAREIGVLLAAGYTARRVRRRFLGEGMALAGGGMLLGLPAGIAYAGFMMMGLRTIWPEAVGAAPLFLHVDLSSLLLGGAVSLATVMLSIIWSARRMGRLPVPALLAGRISSPARARGGRLLAWIGLGGMSACCALLLAALVSGRSSDPAISFGIGVAALASGLALFARWCRAAARRRSLSPGTWALASMAARNCTWNPGRSLLSVALIGCACFVIVLVAASRREADSDTGRLDSGSGGYSLVAESDIPLHQDLNTLQGRVELGLPSAAEEVLDRTAVMPFRMLPGDDASCLNLYQPERPRLLGVPEDQIRRGGFRFHSLAHSAQNPWSLLREVIQPGIIPAIGDHNSVLWSLHLGLGQDLVMQDEFGRPLRLRFVGLLEGSLFQSELLISEENLLAHFPSRGGYSFFLIDAPAEAADRISRFLEKALSAQGFDAVRAADRIASYHAVENTYLATFLLLGGLGLLLGTVGLGVVVMRNVLERRTELAALRAFGFARSTLARMVMAENAFLLCLGMLTGTASALAAVAPRLVSGKTGAPWIWILAMLALVFGVGMVSSIAAVMGALRAPLLPALKEER